MAILTIRWIHPSDTQKGVERAAICSAGTGVRPGDEQGSFPSVKRASSPSRIRKLKLLLKAPSSVAFGATFPARGKAERRRGRQKGFSPTAEKLSAERSELTDAGAAAKKHGIEGCIHLRRCRFSADKTNRKTTDPGIKRSSDLFSFLRLKTAKRLKRGDFCAHRGEKRRNTR